MRMALGASRSNVLRLILSQGMRPVVIGLVVGVFGAFALSKYMQSLLFGVTRLDGLTYGGVATVLGVAGILACYFPARDAMRVDVLTALRDD
jgi:ABC-type antimicrobial peptide transport system permease subunit